jgi:hypothetical protein
MYLDEVGWNTYCQKHFGVPASFGSDAYKIGCQGVRHPFNIVSDVCNDLFGEGHVDSLIVSQFYEPRNYAWRCIPNAQLAGEVVLSTHRLTQLFRKTVVYVPASPEVTGYQFADGTKVNLGDVCSAKFGYWTNDRVLDAHNRNSTVQCYTSRS